MKRDDLKGAEGGLGDKPGRAETRCILARQTDPSAGLKPLILLLGLDEANKLFLFCLTLFLLKLSLLTLSFSTHSLSSSPFTLIFFSPSYIFVTISSLFAETRVAASSTVPTVLKAKVPTSLLCTYQVRRGSGNHSYG
jgi:hypothetical protein